MKNNQRNHIGTLLYLISFHRYWTTSYYRFLCSTPFEIICGSYHM